MKGAFAVIALLLAACAPAPVSDPEASAIYAAAFGAHGRELPADAKALLFSETVRGGLEHLAIRAGHDPDAPVSTMRDAIAARLAGEGLDVGDELDAFLTASQGDARRLPPFTVPDLTFVSISEGDYRDRIASTRDCAAIFAELGFDDTTNVGLWFTSPIGFDAARERAFVYVGHGDVGEVFSLARDGKGWTLAGRVELWRAMAPDER